MLLSARDGPEIKPEPFQTLHPPPSCSPGSSVPLLRPRGMCMGALPRPVPAVHLPTYPQCARLSGTSTLSQAAAPTHSTLFSIIVSSDQTSSPSILPLCLCFLCWTEGSKRRGHPSDVHCTWVPQYQTQCGARNLLENARPSQCVF